MPGVFLGLAARSTRVALGASAHVCNAMGQVRPLWEGSAVFRYFAYGALVRFVCRATLQAQHQIV